MIKEAIDRIIELAGPKTIEVNNEFYSKDKLNRIPNDILCEPLQINSLKGLIDYIKAKVGYDFKAGKCLIHIISPTHIRLISDLNGDGCRETYVDVVATIPEFRFGYKYNNEEFLINVQAKFVDSISSNDKELLLKFAGTVKTGSVSEYGDDGVSQKATVKVGVSSLTDAKVPSPCRLYPYRTFTEIDQPGSEFIFRMFDDKNGGVDCALYEADGGAWMMEAKASIHDYLKTTLEEIGIDIPIVM